MQPMRRRATSVHAIARGRAPASRPTPSALEVDRQHRSMAAHTCGSGGGVEREHPGRPSVLRRRAPPAYARMPVDTGSSRTPPLGRDEPERLASTDWTTRRRSASTATATCRAAPELDAIRQRAEITAGGIPTARERARGHATRPRDLYDSVAERSHGAHPTTRQPVLDRRTDYDRAQMGWERQRG